MKLHEIVHDYNDINSIIDKINQGIKSESEKIKLYEQFFDHIKDEFSQIIKIYKITSKEDKFLFRGIRTNNNEKILSLYIKENRNPRDTPKEIHNFFNKTMKSLGFYTNRSNSIFCTPSIQQAKFYGKPYIVFPKNGFKYVWGKEIKDLYSILVKVNHRELKKIYKQNKLSFFIGKQLYYAENEKKLKDFYNQIVNMLMEILDRIFGEKYQQRKEEFLKENNFVFSKNPNRKDIEELLANFEYYFERHHDNLMKIANFYLIRDDNKIDIEEEFFNIMKENYTDENIIDAIINHNNEIMISNPVDKRYYCIGAEDKNIIKKIILDL